MKLFPVFSVLVGTAAVALGQLLEIGAPAPKSVLHRGRNFTAQIIEPANPIGCTQVGIALALAVCYNGVCPPASQELGDVLYAGPWNPTSHAPGGFYQNFTLQVPQYSFIGHTFFTVTHLCLLGAGPYPLLQFLNVSVTIEDAPKAAETQIESQIILM